MEQLSFFRPAPRGRAGACAFAGSLVFLTFCAPGGAAENVNPGAGDADRVKVMWGILGQVVDDLDKTASPAARRNVRAFLLHVAWHEGAMLKYRTQQPSGPGRSFFQFEPARAREAVLYAKSKGWLDRLAKAAGTTEAEVGNAATALPGEFGKPWPKDSLIEKLLGENDLFGAILARVAFKKVPASIPEGNQKHAEYWAAYWKIKFDSDEQKEKLIKRVKDESDKVDTYIPK